jgi:type VI secretion system ImpM family protein
VSDRLEPFVFGKLPIHGDFLRVVRPGPEGEALDRWIAEGLERAHEELGAAFDAEFASARPLRFVARDENTRRGVVGVWRPSRDAAGRRYPVVAGFTLPSGLDGGMDQWPLGLTDDLARLETLLVDGAVSDLDQLGRELRGLDRSYDEGGSARAWQAGLVGRSIGALFGTSTSPCQLAADAIARLAEAVGSHYPPRYVLRAPGASEADASLWLALVGMRIPRGSSPRFACWPAPGVERGPADREGVGGFAVVLDVLRPRYVPALLWPERRSDVAFDVTGRVGSRPKTDRLPCSDSGSLLDVLRAVRMR